MGLTPTSYGQQHGNDPRAGDKASAGDASQAAQRYRRRMAYLARAAARSERLRGIVTGERADVSDRDFLRAVEVVSDRAGEGYGKVSSDSGSGSGAVTVVIVRDAVPGISASAQIATVEATPALPDGDGV